MFAQRAAWDMCRKLGVEAPVAQTYPEQPCGADAQAYKRLCAEAERKTHESATQGEPQTAAQTCSQTCAQNAGQSATSTKPRNAGRPGSQTEAQTCPQNPSPSDTDRTASSKEVVCA